MGRSVALYEVVDGRSDEVISRHRTRQAAVDAWRTRFTGFPVQIRRVGHRPEDTVLVVAGVWHENSSRAQWPTPALNEGRS